MATCDELPALMLVDQNGLPYFNPQLLKLISSGDSAIEKFYPKLDDPSTPISSRIDKYGKTLLHHAIGLDNVCVAKRLIDSECSIHTADYNGQTPLQIGLTGKDIKINYLLAVTISEVYVDADVGRDWLRTILADATWRRWMARVLMPKLKTKNNDPAILARILIAEKCQLCYAIYTENPAVVKAMIDDGCSMEAADGKGNTALHLAVRLGQVECVRLLVERGADVNALNMKRQIPLNHSTIEYHTSEYREILKLLVDNGSQWWLIDDVYNKMQIYEIVRRGHREAVEIVLNANVNFSQQDPSQRTVLHYMVKNRNPGVFELLESRSFDANVRDKYLRTPLHCAVKSKFPIACRILLDKGADVNATSNSSFMIPLFFALAGTVFSDDSKKCVELLLVRGADMQCAEFWKKGEFTIFPPAELEGFEKLTEILVGHIALTEALGTTIIQPVRRAIEASCKAQYELCRDRLEQMRAEPIYEEITLLGLMSETESRVVGYMGNKELREKIQSLNCQYHFNDYCNKRFHQRISEAIRLAELKRQAAIALSGILDFIISSNSVVVAEIISYLDSDDLQTVIDMGLD